MSFLDLETAAIRVEEIGQLTALLAMAAEAHAENDHTVGKAFQAGAEAIGEQLVALGSELDRLVEVWRGEPLTSPPGTA
jgi:hypothetical protein